MNITIKNLKGGGKTLSYLLAGVFALATTGVWAANRYWTGGGSDTLWNTAGNWDSLPGSSDSLFFRTESPNNKTVTLNGLYSYSGYMHLGLGGSADEPYIFEADAADHGLTIQDDVWLGYHEDGGLWLKSGTYTFGTKSGKSLHIGQAKSGSHDFVLRVGDGTSDVSLNAGNSVYVCGGGGLIADNAKMTVAGSLGIGALENDNAFVTKTGGDWLVNGDLKMNSADGSTSIFYHRGGNLVVANDLCVQDRANGEFYMEGGHVTVSNIVRFGNYCLNQGNIGNLYLNGGVFEAKLFRFHNAVNWQTYGYVVFNGGTYKAMADGSMVTTANCNKGAVPMLLVKVGSRGGTIDTAGYDVIFPLQLLKDGSVSGPLTVKGGGSLALSNSNITYNNKIFLEAGTTLAISNDTAAANILANGIELTGTPEFDKGYTVFVCNKELAESDLDNITCSVAEITKSIGADGKSIVVTVTALKPGYWTGAKDNNLSDPGNWSDRNVPTSGNANIFCTTSSTLTKGASFAPSSITFLEGSAAVTIVGDAISGIASITNLSSVSHTINVPVYFTGDIQVKQAAMAETGDLTKAHVTFAGGAYAAHGCSLENGDYAANYSRCIFGKYYLDSTADNPWTAQYQSGNKRVCVADGSYLYVPYAGDTKELYVGTGAKVNVAKTSLSTGRLSYKNYGEMVVTNLTLGNFSSDLYLTWNQGVSNPSVFRFNSVTNTSNSNKFLYFADGNVATKTTLYFGAGGVGFSGSGLKSTSCIVFGKDANNNETTIRPWDSDFTIGGKSNGGNGIRFSKRVIFNTDDDSGDGHTITLAAKYYGGTGASVDVVGSGTLLVTGQNTGGNALPMTVTGTATLAVDRDGSLGTSTVTLEAGSTLALMATSSQPEKLISNTLNLPTEGKAKLRIDGTRLLSGNHVIATLGEGSGTADNVELDSENPGSALDGRKATFSVDSDKNLILNIEPNGFLMIIR